MSLANEATLLWEWDMSSETRDPARLQEAKWMADRSREICEDKSLEKLVFVLGTCGLIARSEERWDDARRCFERQVCLARKVGDPDDVGRALLNTTMFNIETKEYEKAVKLGQEAKDVMDQVQDPDIRRRLGLLLRQLGQLGSQRLEGDTAALARGRSAKSPIFHQGRYHFLAQAYATDLTTYECYGMLQ